MCKFIIACLISLSALSFSSCTQKKVATSVAYMDFPQTIELKARVQPIGHRFVPLSVPRSGAG